MTPANLLTIFRMLCVPIFLLLILNQEVGWAILVFFMAGATDCLDGLLARRFGQRTALGAILDPVADKVLLVSSFIILSLTNIDLTVRIPLWLTVTVITRDALLITSVLAINLAIGRRIFPPAVIGKLTTATQLLLILAVLLVNYLGRPIPGIFVLIWVTFALTVTSGLHYLSRGLSMLGTEKQE